MIARTVILRFALAAQIAAFAAAHAEERTETFDMDPEWDGLNNRPDQSSRREVTQDFGYVPADGSGGLPARIGGTITPDGVAAYYAVPIPERTFDDRLRASGTLAVQPGGGNVLLGFFNSETVNEWRTPNSIAFRINGRGKTFHVHSEYTTCKWRAGAGVIGQVDRAADRVRPIEIPSTGSHDWSLEYDPHGNHGTGTIVAVFDGYRSECNLSPEHRADGASFNRFGLLNVIKSVDGPGVMWIGNLDVMGKTINLDSDPKWEGRGNRITYLSEEVRPRFNFGFSPTHHAKGAAPGEIGGLFFRGDCRYPDRLAYYGARIETLTLAKAIKASGKVTFHRGVSDSTTLFGFFHSEHSVHVNPSQKFGLPMDVLGFCIEGPSAEGFFVYPVYRVHGDEQSSGYIEGGMPRIYPDSATHEWKLEYIPPTDTIEGCISLTFDGMTVKRLLLQEDFAVGAQFNRFGFVTPWIDGNGQVVYLDDLTYTYRH
ncbi:MAG: hypothetical protein AMXMBFR4_09470 [Candidatus Hydrogenedentota bacterium]